MIDLFQFLGESYIQALGWTFIHSIWQGAVIALLMIIALKIVPTKQAVLRYWISFGSLILVLLSACVTFLIVLPATGASGDSESGLLLQQIMVEQQSALNYWIGVLQELMQANLPTIVSLWLLGMLFLSIRLAGGFIYIGQIKRKINPLPEKWQLRLHEMATSKGYKKAIRLAESGMINLPVAIGLFKPFILFPVAAVNKLSTQEVEAIIAHELAHHIRNDYFQNILQSIIEVIFYYNPAVWWISATVRHEREHCCDDMAVELCGNSLTYAKALVSLEDMQGSVPALVLPVRTASDSRLLNRIRRILNQPQNRTPIIEKLVATGGLLLCLFIFSMGAAGPVSENVKKQYQELEVKFNNIFQQDLSITTDTIPEISVDKMKIRKKNDDGEVEMVLEDNEIILLRINGQEIPKDNYQEHKVLITELREEAILPPLPPTPPLPEHALFPPDPPVAPRAGNPDVPAPPPAPFLPGQPVPPPPPAAPEFKGKGNSGSSYNYFFSPFNDEKFNSKGWGLIKGEDMHRVSPGKGEKEMEIQIEDDGKVVIINGKKFVGDTVIVLKGKVKSSKPFSSYSWVGDGNRLKLDSNLDVMGDSTLFLKIKGLEKGDYNFDIKVPEIDTDQEIITNHNFYFPDHSGSFNYAKSGEDVEILLERIVPQGNGKKSPYILKRKELTEEQNAAIEKLREIEKLGSAVRVYPSDLAHQQSGRKYNLFSEDVDREKRAFGIYHLGSTPVDRIFREMKNDRLIDGDESNEILLTESKLKINGTKVSEIVHQKYIKLYEEYTGSGITGKTRIELKHN